MKSRERMMFCIHRKLIKRKTFIKYLFSYILVFLLPIFLILFHFYPETARIVKEEAQNSEMVLLSQINDYVTIQVNSLLNCASAVHMNRDLTSNLFFSSSEFNTVLIMQEMKKIFGTNLFVERAFLYSASNKKFYSHIGTICAEDFGKRGSSFYYENWEQKDIVNFLSKVTGLVIRPSETVILPYGNVINAVTFIIPIPLGSNIPYAVLMIVVEEESFFSFMKNEFEKHSGNIVILDNNNIPIVNKENAEYLYSEEFYALLGSIDSDEVIQAKLSGTEYIISVKKSDSPAFTYVSLTPVDELLNELNKTKRNTMFLVLLIVAGCLVIIVLAMKYNYKPINTLKEHIQGKIPEEQGNADDFQLIQEAILKLQDENKELVNRILLNKNIVSEYFLIQFVNGNIDFEDNLTDKARDYNINLKEKVCCFTFYAPDRNTLQLLNGFNELLKLNSDQACGYLIKGIRHEDFTLILTFDDEENIKVYYEMIYKMISQTNGSVKIGVGTIEDIYDAGKTYTLSLVALENAILDDNVSVLFYDEVDLEGNHDLICFFDYLKNLEMAIYRKDLEQMRFSMDKIKHLIKTKIKNVFKLRTAYITVHNLLVKELKKYGLDRNFIYDVHEIKNFDVCTATADLEELYQTLAGKIGLDIKSTNEGLPDISEIILFLEDNYSNSNLSLQYMASMYDTTYSNFSHYFKKCTKENYSSYLERIRIRHAKELLKTHLPVDKIALKVGYTNANSFNRAFKRLEGMTPGEFRKNLDKTGINAVLDN